MELNELRKIIEERIEKENLSILHRVNCIATKPATYSNITSKENVNEYYTLEVSECVRMNNKDLENKSCYISISYLKRDVENKDRWSGKEVNKIKINNKYSLNKINKLIENILNEYKSLI